MRFLFYLLCPVILAFSKPLELELSARSAVLMNAETKAILFEKDAHIPSNPASTTKIATALYVLENNIDLNQVAVVSRKSLKEKPTKGQEEVFSWWLEPDGTMMGLKAGEKLSIDALLHGLMLISGNDAANVIAECVAESVPEFMQRVNGYLASIGCKDTHFTNPHGLTDIEHQSTAYDLALMTQRALQIPKFRTLVSTLSYMKPVTNKQPQNEILLTNPLLKPKSRYYYPKAIGVKTGYTKAAKYNLVAAAEHEERTLIAVVLGCEDRNERYVEAKKLFETAFNETKAARRLIGPENIFYKEIEGSRVPLKATVMVPLCISYFPSEEPECKAVFYWKAGSLPIYKGQKVGEVHICDLENRLLEKGDLVALEDVKGSLFNLIIDQIAKIFR